MHYISTITLILCFLGIGASVHDLVIEVRKEADPDYVALVDLGENLSCTAVLTSKWGRGFGIVGKIFGEDHFLNIRNPYFGFLFYGMVIILSQMKKEAAKVLNRIACAKTNSTLGVNGSLFRRFSLRWLSKLTWQVFICLISCSSSKIFV